MPTIGEQRHSSAGNRYQLERINGPWRYVRRLNGGWDKDVIYRWHASQWEEQLPLVGESGADYPFFGLFIPLALTGE